MTNPMTRLVRRAAYGAASTAKVGWYSAHYAAGRRIVGPMTRPGEAPKPLRSSPPDLAEISGSFRTLFLREAADVANGVYRLPRDTRRPPSLRALLSDSRRYFREARAVAQRAQGKGGLEVRDRVPDTHRNGLPGYYQQNFHFQTDGWLTEGSARVYDTQVETLFTGSAGAMRRRALPFLRAEVDRLASIGRAQDEVVFADIACGTAPLLADVTDNFPALRRVAVDLSGPYLQRARRRAGPETLYVKAPAERLPLADGSVDVLCTVYLFHELPPKVRREVAREFARVLRPGGLYLHVDSIQYGDTGMDALLESFPRVFHEPYYDGYAREDLAALFAEAGLTAEGEEVGFLTKASAFRKARQLT